MIELLAERCLRTPDLILSRRYRYPGILCAIMGRVLLASAIIRCANIVIEMYTGSLVLLHQQHRDTDVTEVYLWKTH